MDWTGLYSFNLWHCFLRPSLDILLSFFAQGKRWETSELSVGVFSHSWCWQLRLLPGNSTQVMNLCKSYISRNRYEISKILHSVSLHLHECTQAAPHRSFFCGDATSASWATNRVRACSGGSTKRGACYSSPGCNAADCRLTLFLILCLWLSIFLPRSYLRSSRLLLLLSSAPSPWPTSLPSPSTIASMISMAGLVYKS